MLCVTSFTTFAQEPEQIESGPYGTYWYKNEKSLEYFDNQIKLWEKKVHQNKKDANAWLNLFNATKRAWTISIQQQMINKKIKNEVNKYNHKKIAEEAYEIIPNSFEANYMMHFKESTYVKANYDYLLKAQELKKFDISILCELLLYYELIQNFEKTKEVAIKIFNSNILSNLEYINAYNILSELNNNAVLITEDQEEFTACVVIQKNKNLKPNVVISTHFILNPAYSFSYDYSDKTFARLGLKCIRYSEDSNDATKKINNFRINQDGDDLGKKNFELLFNSEHTIYISNSSIMSFMKDFSDKLYLHGLTYRYSKTPTNYIYNIKENYEKNYTLDFIKYDILPTQPNKFDQSLYYMYYPSALKLYEFYKEKGLYIQQLEMKKFIQLLAEKSGKDFIKNNDLFKENEVVTYSRAEIDFDKLQKSFVALNAAEHIGKFEVTNGEYNLFLKNLKQTKNYELYYKCMIDSTRWSSIFPTAYHDPMIDFYHHHPAYANYPIVNIPYEGAVAYCKWLTVQYNQQHPEGKYVSFRLPSEQEWRYAAGSKNEKAITSFPNDNILTSNPNIKELKALGKFTKDGVSIPICYLGNIKTDSGYQADGGFHTTTVTSYPPNALGIYNTFGNVAEMTSTKGIIKGGSWADLFSECTFDKNTTYSAPDPRVGFRIMMEVVPEIKHNSVVKIEKNVYCRQYEEKVIDYWLYLREIIDLYGINSSAYKNAFPDSTLWEKENLQELKLRLNWAEFIASLKSDHETEKTFTLLGMLTKTQLDNYLKYRSDEEFKNYLIENEYIKNLHMQNNPPIFTREAYYAGNLDSICLKEKIMYYPVVSVPTEHQKQLANSYTNKQLEKGEYAPTNPNSIYSSYVNKIYYDLIQHKSKSVPTGYYRIYELKKGVKTSDIKPFDLWENYRFVLTWQPWKGKVQEVVNISAVAPCNAVKITQNLYCDQYDLLVKDYKRFVDWNKNLFGENSSEYKNALPDTSLWNETKKLILFDQNSKVDCKTKEFETLNNLTNIQLEKFNEWRSNQAFKDFLISKKAIQNISTKNETKENYFTKEKYFNNTYPYIISSETINYYPNYRLASENEKRLIQKYSDSIVTNNLYDFKKGLAIHSTPFLLQNFNLILDTHSSNADCLYYFEPKSKKSIPPFNIWENYRMIVEWKPWNPNQTK